MTKTDIKHLATNDELKDGLAELRAEFAELRTELAKQDTRLIVWTLGAYAGFATLFQYILPALGS